MKTPRNGEYSNRNKITIRAHHLLCLQGFQGYGYSRDFEANLAKIVAYLESHPQCRLRVVAEADAICRHCPHQEGGRCRRTLNSAFLMEDMDLRVMEKLELKEGQEKPARHMFYRVNEVFKTPFDLEGICGDCSWRDKCLWSLALLSRDE